MKETDTHIYFWGGPFSNWYKSKFYAPLTQHGGKIEFNCSEQMFMALKALTFDDFVAVDKILKTSNPRDQKAYGREIKGFNDDQWLKIAPEKMYTACGHKFTQNLTLLKILLDSFPKTIVEASPKDILWGVGLHYDDQLILDDINWNGKNWLGKILVCLRNDIKFHPTILRNNTFALSNAQMEIFK